MNSLKDLGLEEKFIVINKNDVGLLSEDDREELYSLVGEISIERHNNGKEHNEYLVINADEPYAEEVAAIIKKHETTK